MFRAILIFGALFLAYAIIRHFARQGRGAHPAVRPTGEPAGEPAGEMVRCARCDLHIPRDEALESEGRFYCCEEHRSPPPP